MKTRSDALGNLAGRRGGPGQPLLIGSHLDTVADAGRYDGILGVLSGSRWSRRSTDTPRRGRGLRRRGGPALPVARSSAAGRSSGGWSPASSTSATRRRSPCAKRSARELGQPLYDGRAAAYFEVHIEQGPVLEAEGAPLGVVTAIAGQTPLQPRVRAAAPATPARRRWACAATRSPRRRSSCSPRSGWRARRRGWWRPSARSAFRTAPCNVIPGRVEGTLDVRHQDDARPRARARRPARARRTRSRAGAADRGRLVADRRARATPCTPALVARLADVVRELGVAGPRTAQRRRARCGDDGRGDRRRDAVRPLRRRHQPPPGRVRRRGRRRARHRGRDALRQRTGAVSST